MNAAGDASRHFNRYTHVLVRSVVASVGILLLAAQLLLPSASHAQPSVTSVRIGDHAQSTRFVMDLDAHVDFHVFALADPYRIVLDLPELSWKISSAKKVAGKGLVKDYRFGMFQPGTSRLVLDLSKPVRVKKSFILKPNGPYGHRLVIDLEATDRATFMANLGKTSVKPVQYEQPKAVQRKYGRKTIIVDPGHGGVDPGTISARGHQEKAVTLRAGKALKKKLEATGRYNVVLTRDKDFFIPLRERVNISRRNGGDLFISLHADSIKDRRIRGATIYTLSETSSDKEAAALAAKENKADIIAGVDLQGQTNDVTQILIDLSQRETMNYSAEFANMLVPEMAKQVKIRKNPHRFAGFRVLKGPDVPAVLVEMGYLSNRQDTDLLISKKGVDRIAIAITKAVDRYFKDREAQLASP